MDKVILYIDDDRQAAIDEALAEDELPEWILELLREIDTWKEPQ